MRAGGLFHTGHVWRHILAAVKSVYWVSQICTILGKQPRWAGLHSVKRMHVERPAHLSATCIECQRHEDFPGAKLVQFKLPAHWQCPSMIVKDSSCGFVDILRGKNNST